MDFNTLYKLNQLADDINKVKVAIADIQNLLDAADFARDGNISVTIHVSSYNIEEDRYKKPSLTLVGDSAHNFLHMGLNTHKLAAETTLRNLMEEFSKL
jgi:hypothetical protein